MSEGRESTIRVLHVDDDPDLAEVVALHLERAHDDIEVVTETSAEAGLVRLREDAAPIDCVVSDHDMQGMDGLEFLRAVRDRDAALPFLLFTGKGSEEIASEAISAGVTEYLQKETGTHQYDVLANRIERAVGEDRAKTALEESERMLSTLISNLPGMVYRCRNERGWPMEFVSEGCAELTGYDAATLESGEVSLGEEIIVEADREGLWDRVQTAVDAGEPFEVSYRIETADGDVRWLWERGTGVFEDGDLVALEGFITDITARKQRERELREQQEFIESLLDTIGDPFYLIDPDGELLRWNDRVNEVTGYTDEELAGMTAADFVADEHERRLVAALEEAVETGRSRVQADIVTRDGDRIPFELRGAVLYDADDELLGTVGIGRDMSDRIERKRELEQYRTLVENVGDPMYVLDTDGAVRMVNHAMEEYLGYSRGEIEGHPPTRFTVEADVGKGDEVVRALLGDDEADWRAWEMRTVAADGTVTTAENKTAVLTDEDGSFAGSVGVIRDITERKERERELERSETIIQAVGDPVYSLDAEGRFTFVNEAFESMTGYGIEEIVGEHVRTVARNSDVERGREFLRSMIDGDRESVAYEVEIQPRDGEPVRSELHMAPLPFDEEFRGTAGIIRDIEERKRREDRLEEFASVVSHDLRSPLNVILGRVELAKRTGEREHLDIVENSAVKMDDLVEDLLALARKGQTVGDRSPVDLESVVGDAWTSVETGEATLVVEADRAVEAHAERLRELFENLVRNAVEHGGPAVTVTVGTFSDGFYVADDGPGIPPGDRERVFDRGYTTSENGTGFGLAIVRRIAEAHDWSTSLTASDDGGARFEFTT
jgi:PAS domain S-box-containing protein